MAAPMTRKPSSALITHALNLKAGGDKPMDATTAGNMARKTSQAVINAGGSNSTEGSTEVTSHIRAPPRARARALHTTASFRSAP